MTRQGHHFVEVLLILWLYVCCYISIRFTINGGKFLQGGECTKGSLSGEIQLSLH